MNAWAAESDFFSASPRKARRALLGAVVAAHVGALVTLVGMHSAPAVIKRPIRPFDVAIVDLPPERPPEPAQLPMPKAPIAPHTPQVPLPEIVIDAPPPPVMVAVAPPAPVPPAASVDATAPAAPAPVAPPAPPPAPKQVPADALNWAVTPPDDFPPLSRRLNETGKVLLRVVFDVGGHPRIVSLHRSSGFTRLDEQAMASMRKARIHPCKENGVAIECQLIATMVYELED